jgi:hypothetical protein
MAVDLISSLEVGLLLALRTNNTLAEAVECWPRTARLHTTRPVRLGVRELRWLFPAPVFRLKGKPIEDGVDHIDRMEQAGKALELRSALQGGMSG